MVSIYGMVFNLAVCFETAICRNRKENSEMEFIGKNLTLTEVVRVRGKWTALLWVEMKIIVGTLQEKWAISDKIHITGFSYFSSICKSNKMTCRMMFIASMLINSK